MHNGEFECVSDVTIEDNTLCGETDHFSNFAVGNFKSTDTNNSQKDNGSAPAWAYAVGIILGVAVIALVLMVVIMLVKRRRAQNADSTMQTVELENTNPYHVDQ